MAFVQGFKARVLAGPISYSAYATGFGLGSQTDMLNVDVLTTGVNKAFIPGQLSGQGNIAMLLDTAYATSCQFVNLAGWGATPQPYTVAPSGLTALSAVWLVQANQTRWAMSTAVADKVTATASIITDGAIDYGFSLEDETAITVTGNGTARDLTAQTTNGAVAHLHVTAFSGLTNNVVAIQDSTDGSTGWATIGTFTTITGVTSQRLTIAGTVKRYLRVVDTATGVGSCTRQVSFARR